MLHYYRVLYTTYNNEVKVGNTSGFIIADESEVKEKTIPITWENLEEVYYNYGPISHLTIGILSAGALLAFLKVLFAIKTAVIFTSAKLLSLI